MKEQNSFFMQYLMLTNKLWKIIILFIPLICYIFPNTKAMASEEASYNIVHNTGVYEIRHYADRLVVQVINKNDNNGFRKLFSYISGANKTSEKISMTIPVTQTKENNLTYMQFYLPSKFSEESVPSPTNPEVEILTIKEGFFAVIRYSGRASDSNFDKHSKILENKLKMDNILINGLPIKATYNSPFTLPMFRRNEVMFKVDWKKK